MTRRRELPAMLAIAVLALWGWAGGGFALVLVPVLAGLFIASEGISWWRRSRTDRRDRVAGRRDALTGLATRDRLGEDVGVFLRDRRPDDNLTLYLFDLVGFKKYNDAFGYAAGDALLRHLARRLQDAVGGRGVLYRLRGAQFAFASTAPPMESHTLRARAATALSERGEGFLVEPASGTATIPRQAKNLSEALKLADQEIQSERGRLRRKGIDEADIAPISRRNDMPPSPFEVAELAVNVGHVLGLDRDDLEIVQSAAAWRDVGMMAIPEEIVHATGPLSDSQWHFVKLHTFVGERLLRANFGLSGVADVVRSSHERWDGAGYPEGRTGDDIPLGARIVFVCSAFQDMTAPRAHRTALSAEQALTELQRNAGAQFDPQVVAAFIDAFSQNTGATGTEIGSAS